MPHSTCVIQNGTNEGYVYILIRSSSGTPLRFSMRILYRRFAAFLVMFQRVHSILSRLGFEDLASMKKGFLKEMFIYGLRVNHYDFVALHSMRIFFLKGLCVLVRVEIIHKSKFLPGTVEKNSSTIRSSARNRTYACATPVHCSEH